MIAKFLATAGLVVAAGFGSAAPAFADPDAIGDPGCACEGPDVSATIQNLDDPLDGGFPGLADSDVGDFDD